MKMDDVSKSTGDMKDELISAVAEDLNVRIGRIRLKITDMALPGFDRRYGGNAA